MDLCELLGHALATGCSLSSMLALVITLTSCRHCILWQFLLCCIALAVALLLHWCLQVEDRGLASISLPQSVNLAVAVNTLWCGSARCFTTHHISMQVDLVFKRYCVFILRRGMLCYSLKCK